MGRPVMHYSGNEPWNAARPGRRPLPPPPHGMPVRQVTYTLPPMAERQRLRHEFNKVARKAFLEWLAAHRRPQLIAAGMDEAQIDAMVRDGNAPPGWNVHHKLPLGGGGDNAMSNLVVIREAPHVALHQFLFPQIKHLQEGQSTRAFLPVPDGMIFPPPPNLKPAPAPPRRQGPTLRLAF